MQNRKSSTSNKVLYPTGRKWGDMPIAPVDWNEDYKISKQLARILEILETESDHVNKKKYRGIISSEKCEKCQEMINRMTAPKTLYFPLIVMAVLMLILGATLTLFILTLIGEILLLSLKFYIVIMLSCVCLIITTTASLKKIERAIEDVKQSIARTREKK